MWCSLTLVMSGDERPSLVTWLGRALILDALLRRIT
jgi:hypothetical protein